jgi:hypothetical protein
MRGTLGRRRLREVWGLQARSMLVLWLWLRRGPRQQLCQHAVCCLHGGSVLVLLQSRVSKICYGGEQDMRVSTWLSLALL